MKRLTLLFITAILLAGCLPAAAGPTLAPAVSKDQAVELATQHAMASRPEAGPGLETPSNVQAARMTVQAAVEKLHPEGGSLPPGRRATDMVWLVTLDGRWEGGGIALAPNATPPSIPPVYRHFGIILDGMTGEEIESVLQP